MEYTYQPDETVRRSSLFAARQTTCSAKIPKKIKTVADVPVKEIVLGKSLLARFGYWLLMRNARATNTSHKPSSSDKKTKVIRSSLRQNRVPANVLSIVSSGGRRKVVRIANDSPLQSDSTFRTNASAKCKPARGNRNSLSKRETFAKNLIKPVKKSLGVSQINTGNKKISAHCEKNYEQDQFVKTERNIAAAMKEAQKGISAEQLVIRFGLSVPEAGLIASMYK